MYCMMTGHGYVNEIQCISQIFFPNEKFTVVSEPVGQGVTVSSSLTETGIETKIYEDGVLRCEMSQPLPEGETSKRIICNIIQRELFELLMSCAPTTAPWGLLVGIRPTKIVHELWESGMSNDEIIRHLKDFYLVSGDKTALCVKVAEAERNILRQNTDDSVSLYIGIPFCVSRCSYCSFSSYIIKRYAKSADDYIRALTKELDAAQKYITKKHLQTIYIGGGTPTSLSPVQLEALLSAVAERFDVSSVLEYTVEAGRPDTIDAEKLRIMRKYKVGRISVNPQTLNDKTLQLIGRSHSAADFYRAYDLAAGMGFDAVNVDLILGLTGETVDDVKNTLDGIKLLSPDNLTVHTLAVKRASMLKEQLAQADFVKVAEIEKMLKCVQEYADDMSLAPYYMYRQKNMLGNFENVGYCKKGKEGIYNIQIIEEKQTIVAIGAGAATKHVDRGRNLVRRIYNVKTPEEYIERINEMTERKNKLYEFDNEKL